MAPLESRPFFPSGLGRFMGAPLQVKVFREGEPGYEAVAQAVAGPTGAIARRSGMTVSLPPELSLATLVARKADMARAEALRSHFVDASALVTSMILEGLVEQNGPPTQPPTAELDYVFVYGVDGPAMHFFKELGVGHRSPKMCSADLFGRIVDVAERYTAASARRFTEFMARQRARGSMAG